MEAFVSIYLIVGSIVAVKIIHRSITVPQYMTRFAVISVLWPFVLLIGAMAGEL